MAVNPNITYEQAVKLFEQMDGEGSFAKWEAAMNKWGADTSTEAIMEYIESTQINRGIPYYKRVEAGGATFGQQLNNAGKVSGYAGEFAGSYADVVDSSVVVKGSIKTPVNTTTQVVEGVNKMTFKTGLREAGNFAMGSVVPAVAAAGVGITLGKVIDSTLYNANPDFWDSHNMSSLNPETWSSITSDDNSLAATAFNLVFGINSDGTSQAYMDEDALVYIAQYLNAQDAFAIPTHEVDEYVPPSSAWNLSRNYPMPVKFTKLASGDQVYYYYKTGTWEYWQPQGGSDLWGVTFSRSANNDLITPPYIVSKSSFTIYHRASNGRTDTYSPSSYTLAGHTYYYFGQTGTISLSALREASVALNNVSFSIGDVRASDVVKLAYSGNMVEVGGVPGLPNQDGATVPNTTGWNDASSTKTSLQNQYPDLWNNSKHYDYVDENGQNKSKTLIPINLPDSTSNVDDQPTSGDRTQNDPLIDPLTATTDLLKTIIETITDLFPPTNPPTTGTGDSPVTVIPTGEASSLWKIYNPTQAQIDAFGSWLWNSSFVEQIKKLFNDPMQGIIGVHKVFATPSTGGTATIKVGYLDSEVSSNWVDNQYTTVNCGTISLNEVFGNVFDYSPYTKISLYLPFIGIVDLDVADVMRSSINVTYHVDVLTGACLADVKVTRDLASAVMYQYSGSAIVTYPVSSGNYMGMVAGTLSVAAGVAGTILSGGALAPALIGGAVGMSHLHTDVSHSGGFSGCAGAMAGKKPYLIISRPITAMASNYGHFTGKPANAHVVLNNCSGFTKIKSVYVGAMQSATDEEKDMIEAQLKAGVLI